MPASASVITVAGGERFVPILQNAILHMRSLRDAPPLHVHCLDDKVWSACTNLSDANVHCVRPSTCCLPEHGRIAPSARVGPHYNHLEALLTYKLVAVKAQLAATGRPVILLDADALVLRGGCFDEWLAYNEDIVMQTGGPPGCPDEAFRPMGFGLNTGAILVRPGAARWLKSTLAMRDRGYPYNHVCFEQELFVTAVKRARPMWRAFPEVLVLRPQRDGHRYDPPAITLRLLNFSRWTSIGPSGGPIRIARSPNGLPNEPPPNSPGGQTARTPPVPEAARVLPASASCTSVAAAVHDDASVESITFSSTYEGVARPDSASGAAALRSSHANACLFHCLGTHRQAPEWRAQNLWRLPPVEEETSRVREPPPPPPPGWRRHRAINCHPGAGAEAVGQVVVAWADAVESASGNSTAPLDAPWNGLAGACIRHCREAAGRGCAAVTLEVPCAKSGCARRACYLLGVPRLSMCRVDRRYDTYTGPGVDGSGPCGV